MKYENLLQIKPAIDKVKELKKTLPQKKEELRKVEQSLGDSMAEYETLCALLGEPTSNMELANSMLGDMTLLDEALKESVRLKKDVDQLKVCSHLFNLIYCSKSSIYFLLSSNCQRATMLVNPQRRCKPKKLRCLRILKRSPRHWRRISKYLSSKWRR